MKEVVLKASKKNLISRIFLNPKMNLFVVLGQKALQLLTGSDNSIESNLKFC